MSDVQTSPPTEFVDRSSTISSAIYSPTQAALGAFLGGPVGLIYFVRSNFLVLGNASAARKTLLFGIILILILVAVASALPNFPSMLANLSYIVLARWIVEKHQLSKQEITDSAQYVFHSNWRVLGFGLLCLLGSVAAITIPIIMLLNLGLVA